jgi:hypothetical protein
VKAEKGEKMGGLKGEAKDLGEILPAQNFSN